MTPIGAGQCRVGAGGHVERQDLPALDEFIEGRQCARALGRRHPRPVVLGSGRRGRMLRTRRGCCRRAKDARDIRQVEHAEEHGHALNNARPDLVVEGVPVVDVPAVDGFHAEPDVLRGRVLEPLTLIRDRVRVQVVYDGLIGVRPLARWGASDAGRNPRRASATICVSSRTSVGLIVTHTPARSPENVCAS